MDAWSLWRKSVFVLVFLNSGVMGCDGSRPSASVEDGGMHIDAGVGGDGGHIGDSGVDGGDAGEGQVGVAPTRLVFLTESSTDTAVHEVALTGNFQPHEVGRFAEVRGVAWHFTEDAYVMEVRDGGQNDLYVAVGGHAAAGGAPVLARSDVDYSQDTFDWFYGGTFQSVWHPNLLSMVVPNGTDYAMVDVESLVNHGGSPAVHVLSSIGRQKTFLLTDLWFSGGNVAYSALLTYGQAVGWFDFPVDEFRKGEDLGDEWPDSLFALALARVDDHRLMHLVPRFMTGGPTQYTLEIIDSRGRDVEVVPGFSLAIGAGTGNVTFRFGERSLFRSGALTTMVIVDNDNSEDRHYVMDLSQSSVSAVPLVTLAQGGCSDVSVSPAGDGVVVEHGGSLDWIAVDGTTVSAPVQLAANVACPGHAWAADGSVVFYRDLDGLHCAVPGGATPVDLHLDVAPTDILRQSETGGFALIQDQFNGMKRLMFVPYASCAGTPVTIDTFDSNSDLDVRVSEDGEWIYWHEDRTNGMFVAPKLAPVVNGVVGTPVTLRLSLANNTDVHSVVFSGQGVDYLF